MEISPRTDELVEGGTVHAPAVVVIHKDPGKPVCEHQAGNQVRPPDRDRHRHRRRPVPSAYVGPLDPGGFQHCHGLLSLMVNRRRNPGGKRIGLTGPLGVEDHALNRQLVRVRLWPRCAPTGFCLAVLFSALCVGAARDGAWAATAVLAAVPGTTQANELTSLTAGATVRVGWSFGWRDVLDAIGGYPMLVKGGVVVATDCAQSLCDQHPRTGVGIRGDGTLVMVVGLPLLTQGELLSEVRGAIATDVVARYAGISLLLFGKLNSGHAAASAPVRLK